MDLEDVDRPMIEHAVAAARRARIVAIEAATTAAGVAIAEAVLVACAPTGAASIHVAVPRVDPACIVEEVAAAIVLELGVPSAPREDEAGLVDAAAEALRHAAPAYVVFTEPEAWLANGGAAQLASLADETTTRFLVVVTKPAGSTGATSPTWPPGAERVAVAPHSESGMAEMLERRWDVLGDLEREVVRCLARCPVAIPASTLASAIDERAIGATLDPLVRDGVVSITWTSGELFVRLAADAFAIHQRRDEPADEASDESRHFDEGLFLAVLEASPEAIDAGELESFRDADLLARQRAALRVLLARAHACGSDHAGRLTLVAMTAMEPLGPLLEVCALAERALHGAREDALRARLEERRARVLRGLGRLDEAAGCLERAAPLAAALSPRAAARLAFALSRMALPELAQAHLAQRAEEILAPLAKDDALVAGLAANTRAAIAWYGVSAEAAIPPMLEAVVAYGAARREQLQLASLSSLTAHHIVAQRLREGAELARQLDREATRLGRLEIQAIVSGYRGSAALAAGAADDAIRFYSAAIDRLSALGYRHTERWARAHRGLAMLAAGRPDDASRDFEDFVAMTRVVGGSDLVGVIGGSLAGSPSAVERLVALADHTVPAYLRAVVRAVRVFVTDAPASQAIIGEMDASPPGYFAFEVRELERAVLRATSTAPALRSAPAAREMLVARDGSWFELEGADRVSLGRARTLRQVLRGFVVAHARSKPLDLEEVFVLGWPDERASTASRANRVHVTLSRLRATGLGEALAYGEGGWRLDPSLRIVTI